MRCLTWNVSGAVLKENGAPETLTYTESVEYISKCIDAMHADVVCLQEVPFVPGEDFAQSVARLAKLPYYESVAVSPSHLHDNAHLGLCILSRSPLIRTEKIELPNPNVTVHLEGGRSERSHDKIVLSVSIEFEDRAVEICCAHLPAFRILKRHPGEPLFAPLRTRLKEKVSPRLNSPCLVVGDLNTESIENLIPGLSKFANTQELISVPTRVDGTICDQVVLSHHWGSGIVSIIPTWSDHHLCVAEMSMDSRTSDVKIANTNEVGSKFVSVLHLSDLHLGEGSKEDVDWKVFLESAERNKQTDWLDAFIRALPRCPDFVVVSGDLTIGGRQDGFDQFTKMVTRLVTAKKFPSVDRIIVVPGNHDVNRQSKEGAFLIGADRWNSFLQCTDRHVRPWMSGDPNPLELVEQFSASTLAGSSVWGGVHTKDDQNTGVQVRTHFPILFDRDHQVLFYAFNSATVSGTRVTLNPKTEAAIRTLTAIEIDNKALIQDVIDTLQRVREVDAARVNLQELRLFQSLMAIVRLRLPDEFSGATKIAVLHHHVSPIYAEEIKQFELLLNAGKFKKMVLDESFDLVLHGHKHWAEIFIDSAITGGGYLNVISGGTIGGWHARLSPGFFYLEVRPGRSVDATFIPLNEANPSSAFDLAKRTSSIRISTSKPQSTTSKQDDKERTKPFNLQALYRATSGAMMERLQREVELINGETHEKTGWNHFLTTSAGSPGTRVTPFATAFGLQLMELIKPPTPDYRKARPLICETLLRSRRENGGWSASSLGEPGQPFETAVTLTALSGLIEEDALLQGAKNLEAVLARPDAAKVLDNTYAVTVLLDALAPINPESPMVERLSKLLTQAASRNKLTYVSWTPRTFHLPHYESVSIENVRPSVVHTAVAILSLRRVHRMTGGRLGLSSKELSAAASWLEAVPWNTNEEESSEDIHECENKTLRINQFALPICLKALLVCDVKPSSDRIRTTVKELLEREEAGLWSWNGVQWPVWATLDCIKALTEFGLRHSLD
jgi:endonuclease/exonuclease/phosphatase family metal-dependent hydrolase